MAIPRPDDIFRTWLINFFTYLQSNTANVGLLPADATALGALADAYYSALDSHVSAQASARSFRLDKDAKRAAVEDACRALIRRIQASPLTTDNTRALLGITVADATPTASGAGALDGHRATGWVDTSERLRHTIHFADIATPRSTAKPKGIKGCEIWRKIGAPPTFNNGAPVDLEFLALDTSSPYTNEFSSADAGKTVHYVLRWIANDDSKGAWSETIEATIVG